MTITVASLNVENCFTRPRAFSAESTSQGKRVVDDYREFNELIAKPVYSDQDGRRCVSC